MKVSLAGVDGKKRAKLYASLLAVVLVLTVAFSVYYRKNAESKDASDDSGRFSAFFLSSEPDLEQNQSAESASQPIEESQGASEGREGMNLLLLGKDYDSYKTDVVVCVSFNFEDKTVSALHVTR